MQFSIDRNRLGRAIIPALLAGAFVIVIFNGWMAFRALRSLTNTQAQVSHTWQVISQIEQVISIAKDAETGSRGYLITGDDQYLEPYNSALKEMPAALDHL